MHGAKLPVPMRGVTLLELMIVLALMVVIASLAVPELGRQLSRWQMQAVAERLSSDLAEARFAAVQRRSAQHVRIQSGPAWCWSVSELPNCPCDAVHHCQRQRVVAPARGRIVITNDAQLRFEPRAEVQAGAPAVGVASPHGERLQVQLSPLGRARVCSAEVGRLGYAVC